MQVCARIAQLVHSAQGLGPALSVSNTADALQARWLSIYARVWNCFLCLAATHVSLSLSDKVHQEPQARAPLLPPGAAGDCAAAPADGRVLRDVVPG